MLVLSRRAEQQLVFPNLGITVKVLQVRGRLVKIGIEAPQSVKVLRPEACIEGELDSPGSNTDADHKLRNQLHLLQLKIQTLQKKLELGIDVTADSALETLLNETNVLDHHYGPTGTPAMPDESGRAKRLLVVEDCDNERRLMAYLLATHGFDVDVARDGEEALQYLRSGIARPDTILMDMQMPLCDGLETLQQIREDEELKDVRVFAVTGTTRSSEHEPIGRSWDGWFQKPLDVEALLTQLRSMEVDLKPRKRADVEQVL
jgi:carbon storage regulator CsrA